MSMSGKDPETLAQLPRPSSEGDGKVHFGPCFGLDGPRKRKRFEVAAAIDGETLNIYDVRRSALEMVAVAKLH
jgi:hypothetical protein